jgi:predicted MFS family arabinose efflux permease
MRSGDTRAGTGETASTPPPFDGRLALLALGSFAIGTDSFVIAGLLGSIAEEFNISIAIAGQLITIYALCYAVFTPLTAIMTANWPRQLVLLAGISIFFAGNVVAAYGTDYLVVLAGRGISGLGAAIFVPTASATAAAIVSDKRRASALAIMMIALSTATAFGAPIGTVIGTLLGWRYTFVAVAVIAASVAIGVAFFLTCEASPERHSLRSRISLIHDRDILVVLLATFLVLCGLYLTYTYIGAVFDRATQGDGLTLAVLIAVWGLAGTAGSLISGRLTDRMGSRIVINTSLVVLTLNFAGLPWTSAALTSSIIALIVWGLCAWGFVIPQQHRLIGLAPQHASILLSLYAMAVYGGTSVSGAVGALAATFVGYHNLPLIGAALVLCGLAVSEYASRLGRAASPRTDVAVHS